MGTAPAPRPTTLPKMPTKAASKPCRRVKPGRRQRMMSQQTIPSSRGYVRPMASTSSTCQKESWASAVEISAQWLLKMKTTTQVSASSTSRERIAFLREGCWGVLVCSMGQGSFHDTACSITQRNLVFVN